MGINISQFEDIIKDHMDNQPYKIKCSNCGTDLGFEETEVDGDFDLHITLEPCQTCIDSAVEKAKEE